MSIKLIVEQTEYDETQIASLSLAHEVDPIAATLKIDQMVAELEIETAMPIAKWVTLEIDDVVWNKYWILSCDKTSEKTYTMTAQSALVLLDRIKLDAIMYSNVTVASALSAFIPNSIVYTIDASIASTTISGYCKDQSARERLQQICFAAGAMVKAFFSQNPLDIVVMDDASDVIPSSDIYFRPKISYEDVITAIKVVAHTYTAGTPSTVDKHVEVGDTSYIETTQDFIVDNPDATEDDPENVMEVKDCTLIGTGNASEIATRIATYYFNRMKWSGKVIHNGAYPAGQRYTVATFNEFEMISGFATSMKYHFGYGQSADITLEQAEGVEAGNLTIN